jgi:hypothetical protein
MSPTVSSVHCVVLALSFVQYRTCSVPEDLPGKNSAICFHVKDLFSLRSTNSVSSSGVNFSLGPLGRGAGDGICWDEAPPATATCTTAVEGPAMPIPGLPPPPPPLPPPPPILIPVAVRCIFAGRSPMWW